jgi:predicted nucleic acid-binding protein
MPGVVYDTGALLAAERADLALATLHAQLAGVGARPMVPAVVLAQAWRGGPQPRLSRLLEGCLVVPNDERIARSAGAACASARTADVVDAIVVVVAAALGAAVVTNDHDDLRHLAEAIGATVPLHRI